MTILPPLPACPADPKRGAHHLMLVIPETSDGDLTLLCEACGTVGRLPVSGALKPEVPLDDMPADAIAYYASDC